MKESDKTLFLLTHHVTTWTNSYWINKNPIDQYLYRYYIEKLYYKKYSVAYNHWNKTADSRGYITKKKCIDAFVVDDFDSALNWCVQHWMENHK